MMHDPATDFRDAFNACDPARPLAADDNRWVDLSIARGARKSAVAKFRERILYAEQPIVQLFAGHRGCGKSTELRRLQQRLEKDGYWVAYFEVDDDLDLEDAEPPDLLLAFLRNLENDLRARELMLDSALLSDFEEWFKDVTIDRSEREAFDAEIASEAKLEGGVPLFARLMTRLTGRIKTGTESKKSIREKLDRQVSQLIDRAHTFVLAARQRVRDAGKKDLVVIVDSLDRVALTDRGSGRTSHEVLFIERGDLMTRLGCHCVLTVPISLLLSPKQTSLDSIYAEREILPMIKIYDPVQQKPWQPGRDLLMEVLAKRLDLESLMSEGVADYLVSGSGGHPRDLMRLVREAIIESDEAPISMDAAERAFRKLVNGFGRSTPEAHWPLLAKIHQERRIDNDEDHQLMLFNLSVLEYQNDDRWCDVHPAILELPRFQAELRSESKISTP